MSISIKDLGLIDYQNTWKSMQEFTEQRDINTPDEFWMLQHNPVFTLGLAGKAEHILRHDHHIPIVHCDRGGQVTYHGPGQLIIYTLVDLKRSHLSIREFVQRLENGIIAYLNSLGINANGDRCAPGVYVNQQKIASLGLKVRKNCTYHGISFNINMDTSPFNYINVCGYSGLSVTQLSQLTQEENINCSTVAPKVIEYLLTSLYGKSHNG